MHFSFTRPRALAAGVLSLFITAGAVPVAAQSQPSSTTSTPTPTPAPAAGTTAPTPSGPTSLQEAYESWTVACVTREDKKVCAMAQQMANDNGQRVFAIEIGSITPEKSEAMMAFPLNMAVSQTVTLQLDGAPFGQPLPFQTCLPAGCLVPLSLDQTRVASLRAGTTLTVQAPVNGGGTVTANVSLKGFGAAYDRTASLLK